MSIITYLRAAIAVAWSGLRGRQCVCEFCRAHRAFYRESVTAYRAEVRGLIEPASTPAGHRG